MRISEQKKQKIAEQILFTLFLKSPQPLFTSQIADEIVRDEEFTKSLLLDLERKKLIAKVQKSAQGIQYTKRLRWILSPKIYALYKQKQETTNKPILNNQDE